ncbi:MAG: hypothetical protein ABIY55_24805 [Kofleriaceae bacterium]
MARSRDRSFHSGASTQPLPVYRARFRSLASRLVALGIGQMVLLALTAVVVFIAEGPHEPADPEDKLTPAVVSRLEHLVGQPDALSEALDALLADRVEVALYDESRQLIASNVDPPLAIPSRPLHPHRPPPEDRAGPRRSCPGIPPRGGWCRACGSPSSWIATRGCCVAESPPGSTERC